MATLTQKQTKELETIRANLRRGIAYLKSDKVVGIATATTNPNGASYTIRNPACLNAYLPAEHIEPMNKYIGSDIAGLYTALTQLEKFLSPSQTETLF